MYRLLVEIILTVLMFFAIMSDSYSQENPVIAFNLPEGCGCIRIFDSESDYFIRELYDGRPVLISDNHLTFLSGEESEPMLFSFSLPVSDIHWNDRDCFIASDSIIFRATGERLYPLVVSDRNINSFSVSGEQLAFPEDSLIVICQIKDTDIEKTVYKVQGPVSCLEVAGESILYSVNNSLYVIDHRINYRIYETDSAIRTFAIISNRDIIISTMTGIYYVDPDYNAVLLTEEPASEVSVIGDCLYVIFENGECVKITDISLVDKALAS